jgi:hypothetical protein
MSVVYKVEDIERFVDTLRNCYEDFYEEYKNFPAEFGEIWEVLLEQDSRTPYKSWDWYKQEMVKRLHTSRTKLGRALS